MPQLCWGDIARGVEINSGPRPTVSSGLNTRRFLDGVAAQVREALEAHLQRVVSLE